MAGEASRENGKRGGRPKGANGPKRRAQEQQFVQACISAELTPDRVLEELRRLAFSDIRELFDDKGNLRPLHTLTAEQAACIAGVEVVIKNAKAGDNQTDTVHKIKIWDKNRTLEMLAKHFALLIEVQVKVSEKENIDRLLAGRQRVAASKEEQVH